VRGVVEEAEGSVALVELVALVAGLGRVGLGDSNEKFVKEEAERQRARLEAATSAPRRRTSML
jgi:hypothetical protein